MKKNKTILLVSGLGAAALVAYLVWKNNKPAKVNASGRSMGDGKIFATTKPQVLEAWQAECTKCYTDVKEVGGGDKVYTCQNGKHAPKSVDKKCADTIQKAFSNFK